MNIFNQLLIKMKSQEDKLRPYQTQQRLNKDLTNLIDPKGKSQKFKMYTKQATKIVDYPLTVDNQLRRRSTSRGPTESVTEAITIYGAVRPKPKETSATYDLFEAKLAQKRKSVTKQTTPSANQDPKESLEVHEVTMG